ncbi:MAG TPA: hypothetical protein VJG30_03710 [Candidatus Nanoarchaeia archaeon]|nr:hypothetical protein [Candidatus Nanoarchaeia archaeon]
MSSQTIEMYNISEFCNNTKLNHFLNNNGEFITKNESKEKLTEVYHYKSCTVVIEEYKLTMILDVCSDTEEKSKEVFNELEKFILDDISVRKLKKFIIL